MRFRFEERVEQKRKIVNAFLSLVIYQSKMCTFLIIRIKNRIKNKNCKDIRLLIFNLATIYRDI